jgi:hypothetical protein
MTMKVMNATATPAVARRPAQASGARSVPSFTGLMKPMLMAQTASRKRPTQTLSPGVPLPASQINTHA